jgi:hypothetical protein
MGSQASSVYPWAEYPSGVTYNGGIPARPTECGPTLMPRGGGQSDQQQIRNAIANCPAGQHVQLAAACSSSSATRTSRFRTTSTGLAASTALIRGRLSVDRRLDPLLRRQASNGETALAGERLRLIRLSPDAGQQQLRGRDGRIEAKAKG